MRSEIFVQNHRLYYRTQDGFYEDDTGKIYQYSNGKLYEQRKPGIWYWIRDTFKQVKEVVSNRGGFEF